MTNLDLTKATPAELRAALKAAEIKEQKEREANKKAYETKRDNTVMWMVAQASEKSAELAEFKKELHQRFVEHEEELKKYGAIRGNSKGGFSLVTECGQFKAVRSLRSKPDWDERSTKALELINEFLTEKVKKADQKHYTLISSFLARNTAGELDYQKVMQLLTHKGLYKDERWVEGLTLLQESYKVHHTGYGYEFFRKDQENKWEKIEINFTSI